MRVGRQENSAGKHSIKVRDIAERHGIPDRTTSIDDALAGTGGA
jgi:hypothetical protein